MRGKVIARAPPANITPLADRLNETGIRNHRQGYFQPAVLLFSIVTA